MKKRPWAGSRPEEARLICEIIEAELIESEQWMHWAMQHGGITEDYDCQASPEQAYAIFGWPELTADELTRGKISMKKPMINEFYVRGSGHFPFDMLRYDACWPVDPSDSHKVGMVRNEVGRDDWIYPRVVKLATYSHDITPARWNSFGWRCSEVLPKEWENEYGARVRV